MSAAGTASYLACPGNTMDKLNVDLANCYGIKKLKHAFDFSQMRAYALYAPNGVMKSSLAQTFQDLATGAQSADRIFQGRTTNRQITDQNGTQLSADRSHADTSTLLCHRLERTASKFCFCWRYGKAYHSLCEVGEAKLELLRPAWKASVTFGVRFFNWPRKCHRLHDRFFAEIANHSRRRMTQRPKCCGRAQDGDGAVRSDVTSAAELMEVACP
jgi:hypothetical protein